MWTPTRRALSHQSEPSSCGRATASNPAAVLAFPAERTPPSPWQTLRTRTSLMTNQVRDKLSERGSVRKSKTRVRICYKSVFSVCERTDAKNVQHVITNSHFHSVHLELNAFQSPFEFLLPVFLLSLGKGIAPQRPKPQTKVKKQRFSETCV